MVVILHRQKNTFEAALNVVVHDISIMNISNIIDVSLKDRNGYETPNNFCCHLQRSGSVIRSWEGSK